MTRYHAIGRTEQVGGQEIYFRSRGEFFYCQYLDWLKQAGEIKEWAYEDVHYECNNGKKYTPDFHVTHHDDQVHIHEFKGPLLPKNVTQIKALLEDFVPDEFQQYHLVFMRPPSPKVMAKAPWRRLSKLQVMNPELHIHYIGSTLNKLGFKD